MSRTEALYFVRDELRVEFFDEVAKRKDRITEIHPQLFLGEAGHRYFWVLDWWQVSRLAFTSISDAALQLRRLQKNWVYAGTNQFRRGQLIAEALRIKPEKVITFPAAAIQASPAAFTLADKNTMFVCLQPLKGRFAGGKIRFVEDKTGPPSRAYLKLYEAFTLTGFLPGPVDSVLDLGATPGGWSYVAASLDARVQMVDRSEPDKELFRRFPGLKYYRGDGLNPPAELLAKATFLLSDMACEPEKLLAAVKKWLNEDRLKAMVCTLKFHGLSDKKIIAEFAAIPGGTLYHLWHNGHELTWVWRSNRVL